MPVLLLVCVVIGIIVLFYYVGKKNTGETAARRPEENGKLVYTGIKTTVTAAPPTPEKKETKVTQPKKETLEPDEVFFDVGLSNSVRICPRCDSELGMEHASCPVCGWRNV